MTSDGMHSYSWDARNQLSAIDSGATASFVYDSFGRRANKTIFGAQTGFLYDGANPVQELSGTTAIANSLMGGIDEVFQRTDSAGARSFLTDALGSTIALADSSGALQTQYSFEAFGNATITGSGTTNTFAYTGRELDGTGVYFYRARYYHPNLSRFLSEDPIGFNGGLNLYRYVSDDPLNLIDPFGSQSVAQPIPWYWILPFPAVSPWVFAIAGGIGLAIGQLVFPDATARDEDMLRKPLSRPYPKPPTTGRPICLQPPPFPGWDPTQPPTPDAEWRGRGPVGGPDGNWYDPTTGESYHPDLNHPDPIGPHWDWKDPSTGQWWRVFPNGPPALKP